MADIDTAGVASGGNAPSPTPTMTSGTGEFPKQVSDFAAAHPDKYQSLFVDKGWTVTPASQGTKGRGYQMSFQDPADPNAPKLTGADLHDYTHVKSDADGHWSKALEPLRQAAADPDFQRQQIVDYKGRVDAALGQHVTGKTGPTIGDYVTSEQGAALVLDQSVNLPNAVKPSFGAAVRDFDAAHAKDPGFNKDPTTWTPEQRQSYEPEIVQNYQGYREGSGMTDAAGRYAQITGPKSALAADAGSFAWTR